MFFFWRKPDSNLATEIISADGGGKYFQKTDLKLIL
jgi:hypothetical protein